MALSPAAAVAVFFFLALLADGDAAVVEHTFVVSQVRMNRACRDSLVTVVNGQVPGPAIEVTEGDSVVVHVVNKSPHGLTIHWHGVKQRLNCWADGVGMVTQCPIQPGRNFTYRFNVAGQEGTLWWHAHVASLRATVHGALIIRPRSAGAGTSSYPFPKPYKEIPIFIGEWWEMDLVELDRRMVDGFFEDHPVNATINGKLGDLYNCSGALEENYVLEVEQGKTYLFRIVNAALFSEFYLKVAGHRFTVVAADANYVKPYTTDIISIAPGQSVDALVVTDAPPGKYYMVALGMQAPVPDTQDPVSETRGVLQYSYNPSEGKDIPIGAPIIVPEMPDRHDPITSFYFHGNLTSAVPHPPLPTDVNERLFISLALGTICREGYVSTPSLPCGGYDENVILVATMNNVSFKIPMTESLLEAHYHGNMSNAGNLQELPDKPPIVYNFTDQAIIEFGSKVSALESTSRMTTTRRFQFNTTVEIVFQSTTLLQHDSNPMHLHGHDFFVIGQGLGNYNAEMDVEKYNLVDPPVRNTVIVPSAGWAAIRFVTDNPGVWFLHCHYGFHATMGMAVTFEVEDGKSLDTTLPPPPADLPRCEHPRSSLAYQLLKTNTRM